MNRRFFLSISALLAGAASTLPRGQSSRARRLGYLAATGRPADGALPAPLVAGLKELGYEDGLQGGSVGRWAEGRTDRLPALARELVEMKVDVIVANGGPAAQAAKRATTTIPVVVVYAGDVVATRLVAALDRPGGNVTGLNDQAAELSAKRLEILRSIVPRAARVAVLWNADDVAMTLRYGEIGRAGEALRITIVPFAVREPDDFNGAFEAMARQRPDGLLLVSDSLTTLNRKRVISFAAEHRIPTVYEFPGFARDGGLMSYGAHVGDAWRRIAAYVDKCLRGARPGDLPVEQPTKFELVLNLKTAKTLGISPSDSFMLTVDTVLE
jgi:putative ABC transport system substrate-binding protein